MLPHRRGGLVPARYDTVSLHATLAWLAALDSDHPRAPDVGLTPQGWALAWHLARTTVNDEALRAAWRPQANPFPTAVVVMARGVATAALEWVALLLAQGSAVVLKAPHGAPGLTPWWVAHAEQLGLPLSATDARASVQGADLIIAMGGDHAVQQIRAQAPPHARVLTFGHRFSLAWGTPASAEDLAPLVLDHAAHDTHGCMAPTMWLSTRAADQIDALVPHLEEAQRRWPVGRVTPSEHAAIRARDALAAATGRVVRGQGWRIHLVPAAHAEPLALPRCVQLVQTDDPHHLVRPWLAHLSAIAGPPRAGRLLPNEVAPRQTTWGALQAPPLQRHHDGVDHLAALVR